MTDLAVKYFFQTGKDTTHNMVIFPIHEHRITNVGELIQAFLTFELACSHCHFRFKDNLEGTTVWVDIKNATAPLPISKANEVEVKILKMPVPSPFQVASHFKSNGADHGHPTSKRPSNEHHLDESHRYAPVHTFGSGFRQSSHSGQSDFDLLSGSAFHRDHTAPIKKTPFMFGMDSEVKPQHHPKMAKHPEPASTADPHHKKTTPSTHAHGDFEDLLGGGPVTHQPAPRKPSDGIFGGDSKWYEPAGPAKSQTPPQPQPQPPQKPAEKPTSSGGLGDFLDLEINDYVQKTTYTDIKETEARRQRQKIESSALIDPKIKEWAYKNNLQKDLRSLLTTLHEVMDNDPVWKRVELADILTEGGLRKVTLGAIINLHPDKHQNAEPARLYLYQRVVEEINKAFQTHKSQKQG